jgi:hypothetical protein
MFAVIILYGNNEGTNETHEILMNISASTMVEEYINTSNFLSLIGFSPNGFSIRF